LDLPGSAKTSPLKGRSVCFKTNASASVGKKSAYPCLTPFRLLAWGIIGAKVLRLPFCFILKNEQKKQQNETFPKAQGNKVVSVPRIKRITVK
jgi:hypothetical protein